MEARLDIVERLRDEPHRVSTGLVLEAADEIERLREENQRYRIALRNMPPVMVNTAD